MATIDLKATCQAMVDHLVARGMRAAVDHRDLNPPAVWVTVPTARPRFGGCWQVDHRLLLVSPDSGTRTAVATLSDLLADTVAALDGLPVQTRPTQVPPLHGGDALPALELTFTLKG